MTTPTNPSDWRLSDEPPEARERVFEVAPEEDLLYSLGPDGKRRFMHPQLHRGRTWRQRLVLAWALVRRNRQLTPETPARRSGHDIRRFIRRKGAI